MFHIRRILCPIDFSDHARHALRHAFELAAWYEASVIVLHVEDELLRAARLTLESQSGLQPRLEDELWSFAAGAQRSGVPFEIQLATGNPAVRIPAEAERHDADLIVGWVLVRFFRWRQRLRSGADAASGGRRTSVAHVRVTARAGSARQEPAPAG